MGLGISSLVHAAETPDGCNDNCKVGDKGITYSTAQTFFYACPSMELSAYTNGVLGLLSMTYQISGKTPTLSKSTGDPEYEGDTRNTIDNWRKQAHVASFDQAVEQCVKGRDKLPVTLLKVPADADDLLVSGDDNRPFWMPKGFLIKQ